MELKLSYVMAASPPTQSLAMLSAFSSGSEFKLGTTDYNDLNFDQFLNKLAIESGITYGSANDKDEKL